MLSHDEIEEIKSQAFIGSPAIFKDICKIYPLSMTEIITMGYGEYSRRLGTLLLTETDIQKIIKEKIGKEIPLEEIYPLQYLLQSADQSDIFSLELSTMFTTFLQEDVLLLPQINAIQVGDYKQGKRLITEENFRDFQDILRIQNRKEVKAAPPKDETYGERKMRLLREKVAETKRRQAKKGKGDEMSFAAQLEIASVFGIDIKSCTFYAFYGLLRRYQAKEKWNNDIQMLCAGADSNKIKTKYWGESSLDD